MALRVKSEQKFFDEHLLFHLLQEDIDNVMSIINDDDGKTLTDSFGMTLLHHAAAVGSHIIATYFVKQGYAVDAADFQGNTPLMHAVIHSHWNVTSVLLRANAIYWLAIETRKLQFFDALKRQCSREKITEILLELNCPLPRVILLKDSIVTENMLNRGCTVHDRDTMSDCTALHYAVGYHDIKNVKLLLERGADVNVEDNEKNLPLHYYYVTYQKSNHEILA
ncbi:poly [ADP-ribose] polymerase tankyrase-2-like [Phymastichus coffea]|uniref:poly [ADP-ribose] polymerase tankyrase-2-like n=1 Tax=Phymastichus coffea TaxID=108790 RepID=UPI00273C60DF|nr:poly [ADP-ribose] polymerase tankyrase-2-like [Phymastichus coffea]